MTARDDAPDGPTVRRRATTGDHDYACTIPLDAPRAQAYDAVATLAGLRGWWTTLAGGSARPGRTIRLEFAGLDEHIDLRVACARRPALLEWTCLEHTSLPEWRGTTMRFELAARGPRGCTLAFRHVGLSPRLACYAACEAGWDHFLESLAGYVERGQGAPFGASSAPTARPRRATRTADRARAFAALVAAFAGDRAVTPPAPVRRAFGSNALKVHGRIFAMLVDDALVLKLPRARVAALIESGRGTPFDAGRGRAMKEWVRVAGAERAWLELAREAHGYVAAGPPERAPRAGRGPSGGFDL